MDNKKLKKPENLKDAIWRQHLHWMDVMGKQVEENFTRHLARVKDDALRSKEQLQAHYEEQRKARRSNGLFGFRDRRSTPRDDES